MDLGSLLKDCIPTDHARQVHVKDELVDYLNRANTGLNFLDLGCGDGRTLRIGRDRKNPVNYHGIDIEDSPEVRSRNVSDPALQIFDEINIPFPDDHFDIIYSCSVLEHVRYPEPLLREVARSLEA